MSEDQELDLWEQPEDVEHSILEPDDEISEDEIEEAIHAQDAGETTLSDADLNNVYQVECLYGCGTFTLADLPWFEANPDFEKVYFRCPDCNEMQLRDLTNTG